MNRPRCIHCICWQRAKDHSWWRGVCSVTGELVGFRARCQLPEWQGKMKN